MLLISVVGALALAVIAFPFVGIGGDSGSPAPVADPVPGKTLSTQRPAAVVVGRADATELLLPIAQERITAVVFRAVDNPQARELTPGEGLKYEVADVAGASGPDTAGVDIGAPAGTPVYAPINGRIASVSDYLVAGRVEGFELLIEPSRGASIAVRVTQIDPWQGQRPEIGARVSAGAGIPIGVVRDLSEVAELPVGRFTADAGNSVHIEMLATGNIPVG
jgi:hypothetical protein